VHVANADTLEDIGRHTTGIAASCDQYVFSALSRHLLLRD